VTLSKLSPSPHITGGLDVQELSQKLATIPMAMQDKDGEEEGAESQETASSMAAVYGSEGGGMCGGRLWLGQQRREWCCYRVLSD